MELNKSAVPRIFELIRTAYDNAFAGKSENDMYNLVELWYDCLREYPYEVVVQATKNAIKHSEYPPRIATVVKEAESLIDAQGTGDGELWNGLCSALRQIRSELPYASDRYDTVVHNDTGLTTAGEARKFIAKVYNGLDEKVKEYCGNMRGFMDLAAIAEEDMQYEKGRFLKQLPVLAERIKIKRETPPQLANLIKGICENNARQLIGDKK